MPPTIRTTFDTLGNLTAIETFQGPLGWVHILSEPIQRGDVPDLAAAIRERSILDGSSSAPDEARRLVDEYGEAMERGVEEDDGDSNALRGAARTTARTALLRALGVE